MIVKEAWALLRDQKARLSLVLPPLLQLFIFTYATPLDVKNVDIGILDRSGGVHSSELVSRLAGSPNFRDLRRLESSGELRRAIDNQEVIAALVLDADLDSALERGGTATGGVVLDGRRPNAAQLVAGYLRRVAA